MGQLIERPERQENCREDVISRDGDVVFNYLQQHPQGFDDDLDGAPDVLTTDPNDITDG